MEALAVLISKRPSKNCLGLLYRTIKQMGLNCWNAFEQGVHDGAEIHRRIEKAKADALNLQLSHGIPPHRHF